MIALDTNVIVRYLVRDDPDQTSRAEAIIDQLSDETPGFVATIVWAEVYWVLTRGYSLGRTEVVENLAALYIADEIRTENSAAMRSAITHARQGADFADALINATATSAGCTEVVTFDKRAADKLGWRLI
ncbi:MAG: type II toxin-antitoxin system VapC family toxin [Micropruina sp.]|uniref:PIN domain-containing protein n=1 Tax=Micropruina sp. TaxID=2737536 RepID=UPI0039E45103